MFGRRRCSSREHRAPRAAVTVVGTLAVAAAAVGCAARPGPPPVEQIPEEETTTSASPSTTPAATRTRVIVGIDPLRGGLNPHLISDSSQAVDEIAQLVLPSAFVGGERNTDLLDEGELVDPAPGAAQTVRYVISSAAQWSDGTPVSGSDFNYLWRELRNTPGVKNRGGYQSISRIRVSGAGKVVEVDFSRPNAHWRELFSFLLPAHLLRGTDFSTALDTGIPAAAGKYLMHEMDRARGTIELQRNDRFWGADPARIDIVTLRPVVGTIGASDQLRTGQVAFMDLTPAETTEEALELVKNAQTMQVDTGRRLQLTMNVASPVLREASLRAELAGQIDPNAVARLATGRNSTVWAPENPDRGRDAAQLQAAAAERPLRIGADPADNQAAGAARVVVDQLRAAGIEASVVSADLAELADTTLPAGEVDAVIAWGERTLDPIGAASRYGCYHAEVDVQPESPEESETSEAEAVDASPVPASQHAEPSEDAGPTVTESEGELAETGEEAVSETENQPRGSNLSGYCTTGFQRRLDQSIAGDLTPEQLRAEVNDLERLEHLTVGLLDEARLWVLGEGIEGPAPRLADWPAGIRTAPTWRLSPSTHSATPTTTEPAAPAQDQPDEEAARGANITEHGGDQPGEPVAALAKGWRGNRHRTPRAGT